MVSATTLVEPDGADSRSREGQIDDNPITAAVRIFWNFGPSDADTKPVSWVVEEMLRLWGAEGWDQPDAVHPHEANLLKLDCSKARGQLGWKPVLSIDKALALVVDWHKSVASGVDAREVSLRQLRNYAAQRELERV